MCFFAYPQVSETSTVGNPGFSELKVYCEKKFQRIHMPWKENP